MLTLATIFLAAADVATPDASPSGWISGDTLATILSILCGAGGVVGGKMWGEKSAKKVKAELPQPLEVQQKDLYVTRREFDQHVADNERNFEALYSQMRANDKLTAKISGCLEAIQGDLSLIKAKLFGGRK